MDTSGQLRGTIHSSIALISYVHILHMTEKNKTEGNTQFFQPTSPPPPPTTYRNPPFLICATFGGVEGSWKERIHISQKPPAGGESGGAGGGGGEPGSLNALKY
jgi:hypothetical protein